MHPALENVYLSIADAPLDEYTTPDEKDTPDHLKMGATGRANVHTNFTTVKPALVVPFHRVIKKGSKGRDVIGAKRAIWKANGLKVPTRATTLFGSTAVKQLKKFQHDAKILPDGVLWPSTLKKLAPYFDAYAYLLYVGYPPSDSKKEAMQRLFVAYMMWGYNNRGSIAYLQYRPMTHLNDLQFLPISEDCSTWYTKGCKAAGMPNPNTGGKIWDGSGWTGTIAQHGKLVTLGSAEPGAAVLYGPAPDFEHVAGYVGNGRVVSLGSTPGPLLLAADYRPIGQVRQYV